MESTTPNLWHVFDDPPAIPRMSLRGGNAADDHAPIPPFDVVLDRITPEYFETYFWGLSHLDAESWRFYLPHFMRYALENMASAHSNAIDALLFSLRPPDHSVPRFGTLTPAQEATVVAVLDELAFSERSVWQEPAMIALEEYWAPGANYR
jgi:uncharacterized protein DUF6714